MNPIATHIPILLECLEHTDGPVLELGGGWFSTPIVSAFATDRLVVTVEADRHWHSLISQICLNQPVTNHRHEIIHVSDYDDAPIMDHNWSIVFLDHGPAPRRGRDAKRIRDQCQLMIGHDSEHPDYQYEPVFSTFKYRFTDHRLPWTTVVSDQSLDWLEASVGNRQQN